MSTRHLSLLATIGFMGLIGLLVGCGAAVTGIAVGVNLAGGGGGGGGKPNRLSEVRTPQVIGNPYDKITIEFSLVDAESDPADVTVELSTDGGSQWSAPTVPAGQLLALSSSPTGELHSFEWDSFQDIGCQNISRTDLALRLTPRGVMQGRWGNPTVFSFDLLNNYIVWITTVLGGGIRANALVGPTLEIGNDLILCDITGHRVVRKKDADGSVEVLAGTGFAGFNGDGLAGPDAKLNGPSAVVIDTNGDILFSDTNNHRICRVDFSGFLTTEIGTGLPGWVDGPRATAWLNGPKGLAIDSGGDLYIADFNNHRIRLWDRLTDEIRTVAGDGTSGAPVDATPATSAVIPEPSMLAIDGAGGLYTVSRLGTADVIRAINLSGSAIMILGVSVLPDTVTTVAGGGVEFADGIQATQADLGVIKGIAPDGAGLYLTSWNRIRMVTGAGFLSTVAGDGTMGFGGVGVPRLQAQFDFTSPLVGDCLGVDASGSIYVTMLDDVRVVNLSGSDFVRSGISIPADTVGRITPGSDLEPYAGTKILLVGAGKVAAGPPELLVSGEVMITDAGNDRVVNVDLATGAVTTLAGTSGFSGLAGDGGPADQAVLEDPGGLAVDINGNVYIADTGNHSIRFANLGATDVLIYQAPNTITISPGEIETIAGTGTPGGTGGVFPTSGELDSPRALALDGSGNIYVADTGNHAIRMINVQTSTIQIGVVSVLSDTIGRVAGDGNLGFNDGVLATSGRLSRPEGVSLDAVGNIYIADTGNNRLRLVNVSPTASLDIYFGSASQQTVLAGVIQTIAGVGVCTGLGDSGPAIMACLPAPRSVDASDVTRSGTSAEGPILVASGNRVRAIYAGGPAPLALGSGMIDVGNIDTVAGTGISLSNGDGGPAILADILDPEGIYWDGIAGSGILLIQESANLRAVNLSSSDVVLGSTTISPAEIDTIVGASIGMPPIRISDPRALVAESTGDMFVADGGKLIYHFDRFDYRLVPIAGDATSKGFSGDGGPAIDSRINSPADIALDFFGNLVIADTGNSRLRAVNLSGAPTTIAGVLVGADEIQTLAGPGDGLMTPVALAIDASGDIYFADQGTRQIHLIDGTNGNVSSVAGSGLNFASGGDAGQIGAAEISEPRSIALDAAGHIYVIDSGYVDGLSRVRLINLPAGPAYTVFPGTPSEVTILPGNIDSVAGGRPPAIPMSEGEFIDAWDLRLPAPHPEKILLLPSSISPGQVDIYYTHGGGGSRVRRIDALTGLVTTVGGIFGATGFNGDDQPATMAELNGPTGLASFMDINGKLLLLVSDTDNRRVRRFSP
ncbi:MAG: hypothetical protein O7H41_21240 [Planctomycetota bacterium]|nr:hypothetical protein [Planctomycetota bacterium]